MIQDQKMELAVSRAKVIKALGHPTRIFIVAMLSEGEASVGELTEAVGADVSTVSKHLSLLKQAALLADHREGNRILYSLICPCIMEFIHCIDDVILQDAEKRMSCLAPPRGKR